ncbi:hypothetical protein SDC9_207897 [bioreactor metagenome]|uniref:Uncharacterized protein n=1 Tax=bioreactor metagenome TaxID=1076179 RepID=A0A645JAN1_9ZZZZ
MDYVRDVNWREVLKLHRARGIPKQGNKAARNAKERKAQLKKLSLANQQARRLKLKGKRYYAFLKQTAGFDPRTDDAHIRRLLVRQVN